MTPPSQDRIEWGVDQTYLSGNTLSSEYGAAYQHKYLLTNLTPGTKYYYRVTVGGTPYTGSFYAAPAGGAAALKFLAYGDTRSYTCRRTTRLPDGSIRHTRPIRLTRRSSSPWAIL